MVAAMSISVPISRMSLSRQDELSAIIRKGAEEVSKNLGYNLWHYIFKWCIASWLNTSIYLVLKSTFRVSFVLKPRSRISGLTQRRNTALDSLRISVPAIHIAMAPLRIAIGSAQSFFQFDQHLEASSRAPVLEYGRGGQGIHGGFLFCVCSFNFIFNATFIWICWTNLQ